MQRITAPEYRQAQQYFREAEACRFNREERGRTRLGVPSNNSQTKYVEVYEEAHEMCAEYNENHEPGRYSREAEFEEN